ncbi:hypothetical protein GCM10017752_47660 [Streptomyces roseoviridis]
MVPRAAASTAAHGRPARSTLLADGSRVRAPCLSAAYRTSFRGLDQALIQVLPKDGFSSPITLTVLPHALTGMWTGT